MSIRSMPRGQFCDKGSQYRPEIFTHDAEQKQLADGEQGRGGRRS